MSSGRLIIVARNDEDGEIILPLGDLTLYDMDGATDLLGKCAANYGPDWTLAVYQPVGGFVGGTRGLAKEVCQ